MPKDPFGPSGRKSAFATPPIGNLDFLRALEGVLARNRAFFKAKVWFRKAFVVAKIRPHASCEAAERLRPLDSRGRAPLGHHRHDHGGVHEAFGNRRTHSLHPA
jgi:hypothetical protein